MLISILKTQIIF